MVFLSLCLFLQYPSHSIPVLKAPESVDLISIQLQSLQLWPGFCVPGSMHVALGVSSHWMTFLISVIHLIKVVNTVQFKYRSR